jgi:hypothetical protein
LEGPFSSGCVTEAKGKTEAVSLGFGWMGVEAVYSMIEDESLARSNKGVLSALRWGGGGGKEVALTDVSLNDDGFSCA